jgi:hypothetical protein
VGEDEGVKWMGCVGEVGACVDEVAERVVCEEILNTHCLKPSIGDNPLRILAHDRGQQKQTVLEYASDIISISVEIESVIGIHEDIRTDLRTRTRL